jgi:transglutaminase-like putative cysteine protease
MLKRENKWLDIFAAGVLFAAFWVAALRLEATGWSDDLMRIKAYVLFGFVVGYLLGLSRFERWGQVIIAGLYSVIVIPWVLGAGMAAEIVWGERLVSLAGRLGASFELFVTNQPVNDYILYVFSMALLFWFMSLIGGFQLSRNGAPWVPLLVAGALLVSIETSSYETQHSGRYSATFMVFALLSVGRIYFLGERKRWNEAGIAVDSDTGYDLGRSMAVIGLLLVLIAWNIPSISGWMTTGAGNRLRFSQLRDRLSNLTAGLDMPRYTTADFSYGNDLSLGTGVPLEETELFQVQVSRRHPTGIPFYWKSQSYDYYVDEGWKNTVTREHAIEPSEWPVRELSLENRVEVNLTYTIRAGALQTLYLPGQPQYVSRPAVWVGDSAAEDQVDMIAVKAEESLRSGETIKAETRLNDLTVAMLRQAGEDYPGWVTARYLNLPEDFPPSVSGLAEQLAQGQETPYDKVRVITSYLRSEITYENEIPKVPDGEDAIEWFLFTHKAGFCNYYATSEVLMLRSLGIPARMVVGFAEGQEDENKDNLYHIYMNNYHAWPEVFFPGIGWVPVEPTASQPVHSLRLGLAEQSGADYGEGPGLTQNDSESAGRDRFAGLEEVPGWNLEEEAAAAQRGVHPAWIVSGVVLLAAAAAFVWRRSASGRFGSKFVLPERLDQQLKRHGLQTPRWIRRWAERAQASPMERMFNRVSVMLVLLGERKNDGDTAAEQMAVLSKYLNEGAAATAAAFQLAYEQSLFSLRPVDIVEARKNYIKLWAHVLKTAGKRWRGV